MSLFVHTSQDPLLLANSITRVVQSMEPEAPVRVRTLDEIVGGTIARVGQRLLEGVARTMMDRFFACLAKRVGPGA